MTDRIAILVADDHAVVRAGLRSMFHEPDLEIVGEAKDGVEAVDLAVKLAPRVVMMDLEMPRLDGIGATRRIKLACPAVNVVILTTFESEADVTRAIAAGAVAYLLKDAPRAEIIAAVRAAAQGKPTLASKAAAHLMTRTRGEGPTLTPRELDVLERVARGASNGDIAKSLRISEATVKTHLLHAFEKLGVSDRTAAVTVALERKLFRL
jgi:DNA-binding NarL/FixJ family response regulator